MVSDLYDETVDLSGVSIIAGKLDGQTTTMTELRNSDIGILRCFAADDDIQCLQIVSTNIGFVRKYQKRFKRNEKEVPGA